MTVIHGFELVRDQTIEELNTRARLFRHVKTGAELLSMINEDENKVFGITFRTPPEDSTGVPHILEHSVLCGSRRYPVKEPFVEILKGSLQTFLNAFTYPDKTCYPVASQNVQDFYNLIDVYLDAVFYPRITPYIFQQEGWHFELEKPDGPLTRKGVVLNEMKGAYSSPERLLAEYSQQSLFPDNTYGIDSGGDPKNIPDLDFEKFREFHRKYYHPSNSRIFFYGDDDPDERLRLANEYLKDFDKLYIDSSIPIQPRFDSPKHIVHTFASGSDEASRSKGMITVNWLLGETNDPVINMAFHLLDYILLGMPGSPLRKALIDSGLGEDITGGGLESELRQMFFSVGLKGTDPEKADKVEALIIETLGKLAKEGIDNEAVDAALNTVEFALRENNTGSYPRGLVVMLRSLTTWLYDGDPLILLAFESYLKKVKTCIRSEKRFFEKMVEDQFLKNTHRTTVILKPDPTLKEREEAAERDYFSSIKKTMGDKKLQNICENAANLKEMQETPDSPEALATIPSLKLDDLDKKNKNIPFTLLNYKKTKIFYHDLFTNNIAYIDIGFDFHTLSQKYIPYVPLLGRALLEMGTETEDFVKLSQRISRKTGGIHSTTFTSVIKDSPQTEAWLILRTKTMFPQVSDLFDIIRDILLQPRLDNRERFKQMVLEEKARQEYSIVPSGHMIINLRLRSHFDESSWAAEEMNGISYYFFLRSLEKAVDEDWPSVCTTLEEMLRTLINRNTMIVNVTLNKEGWSDVESNLHNFLDELPGKSSNVVAWSPVSPDTFEGLVAPSNVNYVGKGANLYELGYKYHGSARVITRYLRTSWLWDRIRVQGGAYGAFCLFDSFSGVLTFLSYRDPNLLKTIEAFDETANFLRTTDLSRDELAKSIIGTIGDIDAYLLPDAKGYASMIRYLTNNTDENRQKIRDQVLQTTVDDFRAFAKVFDEVRKKGIVKVLSSGRCINEAIKEGELPLKVVEVL